VLALGFLPTIEAAGESRPRGSRFLPGDPILSRHGLLRNEGTTPMKTTGILVLGMGTIFVLTAGTPAGALPG
jgi:hypothetical protein